jgi:hypothetical protein
MDTIPLLEITNFPDLVRLYRAAVTDRPVRCDPTIEASGETAARHISWMQDNMPDPVADTLKFNRWLGFVQGCLWAGGVYTLDQLREQTRAAAGLK